MVERPASVAKELLENAVDAGATKVTVEIRDGGMTFLRVTDNGCGMTAEDARTAFLRHATSKLRCAEDLNAIGTMGFRGEALAAISSVSRIDLLTKTPDSLTGVSLHLEAGAVTEENEAGCPEGTTIIIRDLFYNTPARMKFMKADTVEGSRVTGAVQLQALAHPEVAISLIRDGKTVLSTPGSGGLRAAVYCVYGRDFGSMIPVDSTWEKYRVTGFVSKPTDARPSRNLQTFFVNHRPVKSKLLVSALEEAYRNQLMVGKFPTCVLCLELPPTAVDVNVHPAKTEVKFLNEKAVFDCVHYGVLGALNKTPDRPQVHFSPKNTTFFPETQPEKDGCGSSRKGLLPHHVCPGLPGLLQGCAVRTAARSRRSQSGCGKLPEESRAALPGDPALGSPGSTAGPAGGCACIRAAESGAALACAARGKATARGKDREEAGTGLCAGADGSGNACGSALAHGGGAVPDLYSGGARGRGLPYR